MSNVDLSVSFSGTQQAALVGHCFYSEEFFLKAKLHIKSDWITEDLLVSHIYKELVKFYDHYGRLPTSDEELLSEPFFLSQKREDLQKYKNTFSFIVQGVKNFSLDILRPKVAKFIKTMNIIESTKSLANVVNKQNFDSVAEKAYKIIESATSIDFDKPPYVDFSDAITLWSQPLLEKGMSTGSKHLDSLLDGGVFHGENLAVLAPTFTGKSRFLQTLGRHLICQDRKVLYMIHEDNPEKVKRRIIGAVVGIGQKDLNRIRMRDIQYNCPFEVESWTSEDAANLYELTENELRKAKELIEKNLILVSWQKTSNMYVEDVIAEVKRIHLEELAKTGRGLDVFLNDYPALLGSRVKHEDKRSRLDYVHKQFNVLAAEIKVFTAYAVQVNRAAAKSMKSGEAERMIGLEDVSEAYSITQNAMSSITLNRNPDDIKNNILRISIEKARDSSADKALVTRAAYGEGILYGDYENFLQHGQFMVKGLASHIGTKAILDSTTLSATLDEIEHTKDNLDRLKAWDTMPSIIKKLKKI